MGSRCQFEQAGAFERGQIIFFHVSTLFAGNGNTGYEHQVNGLGQFMLMLPEAFPQEPARPVPGHGIADLLAGNDSEPGGCPVRQFIPICNQAAEGQPLAVLPQTRKVTAPLEARGAPQTQTERWRGVHESKNQTGVSRLRPTRRRLARMALPLLLELRFRNPCWRLRRIFDG